MGSNLRMLGGGGVEVEVLVEVLVSSKVCIKLKCKFYRISTVKYILYTVVLCRQLCR